MTPFALPASTAASNSEAPVVSSSTSTISGMEFATFDTARAATVSCPCGWFKVYSNEPSGAKQEATTGTSSDAIPAAPRKSRMAPKRRASCHFSSTPTISPPAPG